MVEQYNKNRFASYEDIIMLTQKKTPRRKEKG